MPVTIEGIITDATGIPLQGVSVKAGTAQVSTDVNGSFRISAARFTTNETFVIASKAGYFNGSRTFLFKENSNHFLRIMIMPRSEAGSLQASAGGTVNINNSSVSFPANAFVAPGGAVYSGTVSVKGAYINPEDPDMGQLMPGDLRGIRINGDIRGLRSFGMVNVELEGQGGEKLQLKPGITATLSYTIPAGLLATAPASIPLWYFDEATGLWKEEGSAQKAGNKYTGAVNHFTFWNVDDPFQYVLLDMKVINQAQQAIAGARVELTSVTDSTAVFDYTDNNGNVNGYVPINVQLRREIYNECDMLVSSSLIGPFAANTNIGNVQVTSVSNQQTITGTATDCSSMPLANGHFIILMQGNTIYANIVNGVFSASFTSCTTGGTATVIAVNDSTQQQSTPVTVNLTTPVVAAGVLQACGASAQEFITITVDNVTRTWNMQPYDIYAFEDTLSNGGFYDIYMGAFDSVSGGDLQISLFRTQGTGPVVAPVSVGIQSMYIYDQLAAPNMIGDYYLDLISSPAVFTEYGPVGEFLAGSFSGRFIKSTQQTVDTANVTCSWRIRRDSF